MIKGSTFQTRARTVDHLGREQIADCPTAISELWKNAFDAYARSVELNIYDGKEPVAAIIDDGHGMNRDDFMDRWLVVGTETKVTVENTLVADRCGLKPRPRQGQKGIGRLSCANLGPILLLVSKRAEDPFVASLIDWRLFENPFINLSDVFVPVVEFSEVGQLFAQLPEIIATLSENITGGSNKERKKQIRQAWKTFDQLYSESSKGSNVNTPKSLSREILDTLSHIPFEPRHFQQWSVFSGDCRHGTALLVSGINDDLRAHLDEKVADTAIQAAKARFFETLSSFVDPFIEPASPAISESNLHFSYVVRAWEGEAYRDIVGSEKQFDKRQVDDMEHCIEGRVNAKGVFSGRVKAFGEWLPEKCTIEPPKDLTIPSRSDSKVGSFDLFIASMEFEAINTTHSPSEFEHFKDLAEKYSGFMVFRDGLRVLPYGRTDNDFFEIESRRSKNAGREFWNHRQMFGRLAITRTNNPNLKDKAGREGLLDNRAAKTLRAIVSNILMRSARLYFGSSSDLRKELLPQINVDNKRRRADEARNKLRKRQRQVFRSRLKTYSKKLPTLACDVEDYLANLDITDEAQISQAQHSLEEFRGRLSNLRLPGAPKNLGRLEQAYTEYRAAFQAIKETIATLSDKIDRYIEQIKPAKPEELLSKQLASQAAQIHHRIKGWRASINKLLKAEYQRITGLVEQRNKLFHSEAMPLLHRFRVGEISYIDTSKMMTLLKQQMDEDNNELFVSYIGALEILQESIDLEHLATFGMEEIGDLRSELERLNNLAQLGVAVEILGHELQSYDDMIGSALKRLPKNIRASSAVKEIEFGYEGLTDQLRFLSPLRLAGLKVQRWIKGKEIVDYVSEFFRYALVKNHISLTATDTFLQIKVLDYRSRLYPVFINLVNNSIYWLGTSGNDSRKIILDVADSEVVVSDNGPGVDQEDIPSLFSLFFTRKIQGGRGVGLYLCRANLTAGGHTIRYEPSVTNMPLEGANFVISFKGVKFDGK